MNYRTLYVTVAQVGVAKLNRALPASSGYYVYYKWSLYHANLLQDVVAPNRQAFLH